MNGVVILSEREQEYLLRTIEAALPATDARHFFLWVQGQFQALLPHRLMVCLQFDQHQTPLRIECLHGSVLAPAVLARVADAEQGLAVALARRCRQQPHWSGIVETDGAGLAEPHRVLLAGLAHWGLDNVMAIATPAMAGAGSCFVLFGMPHKPGQRHAYFLRLLLPYLHLALAGLAREPAAPSAAARPVSAREAEVLHWLRLGKSNGEIAQILGISGLTVKNHLQRLYRLLGVSNRTQAVMRSVGLRLPQ